LAKDKELDDFLRLHLMALNFSHKLA